MVVFIFYTGCGLMVNYFAEHFPIKCGSILSEFCTVCTPTLISTICVRPELYANVFLRIILAKHVWLPAGSIYSKIATVFLSITKL